MLFLSLLFLLFFELVGTTSLSSRFLLGDADRSAAQNGSLGLLPLTVIFMDIYKINTSVRVIEYIGYDAHDKCCWLEAVLWERGVLHE